MPNQRSDAPIPRDLRAGTAAGASEARSGADPLAADRSLWSALRGTLFLVSAALVVLALYAGRNLLVPFALAGLLAFVLDPLVTRLRHWRVPRAAAVVVVMGCTVTLVGWASVFLTTQAMALSQDLPTYQSNIQQKLRHLRAQVSGKGALDGATRLIDVVNGELEATRRAIADTSADRREPKPLKVEVTDSAPTTLQSLWALAKPVLHPLAMAALVMLFLLFMLFERNDLRDRMMRLVGGDLHRSTEAMNEAAQRVSRYLTTQLAINFGYAVPLALGLWLLGVPGALLWGALGGLMRFVPYLGPTVAAMFPMAMAFAVDPGWELLLGTIALIGILEVLVINLLEPWLYGASTGLAPTAVLVSAAFWTALWGPVGLILATPMTVCLVVMGRHLPRLQFLDLLLGRDPVFDPATRLYQRLLAADTEEAVEMALEQAHAQGIQPFYSRVGLPLLALVAHNHNRVSGAEQRHRLARGTGVVLRELREEFPAPGFEEGVVKSDVVCIGGRWETDALAAEMLAHAAAQHGLRATPRPPTVVSAENIGRLDLAGTQVVVLSYFSSDPGTHARFVCRRLRRQWPQLRIVLGLWDAPPELQGADAAESLGADALATSLDEAVRRVCAMTGRDHASRPTGAESDRRAASDALLASGAHDPAMRAPFEHAAQRAADCFDVPYAVVSTVDERLQIWRLPPDHGRTADGRMAANTTSPLVDSPQPLCTPMVHGTEVMVVPDVARDPTLASAPQLLAEGFRFLAGAPLRDGDGRILGALCLLDRQPRQLNRPEQRLLQAMADELMALLTAHLSELALPAEAVGRRSAPAERLGTRQGIARMAERITGRGAGAPVVASAAASVGAVQDAAQPLESTLPTGVKPDMVGRIAPSPGVAGTSTPAPTPAGPGIADPAPSASRLDPSDPSSTPATPPGLWGSEGLPA